MQPRSRFNLNHQLINTTQPPYLYFAHGHIRNVIYLLLTPQNALITPPWIIILPLSIFFGSRLLNCARAREYFAILFVLGWSKFGSRVCFELQLLFFYAHQTGLYARPTDKFEHISCESVCVFWFTGFAGFRLLRRNYLLVK